MKPHKWLTSGYCVGFVTTKGLMLDLDNVKYSATRNIAEKLTKKHNLEGYLITRSSPKHYHVVFNRYLKWKNIAKILFNQYICIRWAIWQMRKGELTLRISTKNEGNPPKIIRCRGKTDKLINDYLYVYYLFNEKITKKLINSKKQINSEKP